MQIYAHMKGKSCGSDDLSTRPNIAHAVGVANRFMQNLRR